MARPFASRFFGSLVVVALALPTSAHAAPEMTPAKAREQRAEVEQAAQAMRDKGDLDSAVITLDGRARDTGDPVLFLAAADAFYEVAKRERDVAAAKRAIDRARIAQDILYFHLDSAAYDNVRFVESDEVPALLSQAEERVEASLALIDEIESAQEDDLDAEPIEPEPPPRPGRGKIIAGAVLTTLGIGLTGMGFAGLGLGAQAQGDAEDPLVYGEDYDEVEARGKRANAIAISGLTVGGALLVTGVTLIVLGSKQRDRALEASSSRLPRLSPWVGRHGSGLTISGRF